MPDIMRDFACHACRAADGAQSPAEELEVALDAMFSMQAPFHRRYHLFSAMQRRVGGQGMVQFASIFHTQEQVCSCSRLPVHLRHTCPKHPPCSCRYSVFWYGMCPKLLHTERLAPYPHMGLLMHVLGPAQDGSMRCCFVQQGLPTTVLTAV